MTKIKICGLTRCEDIQSVNRCRPDYIGLVFCASRRRVTPAQAALLKGGLDPRIKAVGVFVNEMPGTIIELCKSGIIDGVQLHGDENEVYIKKLKKQLTCPLIKAIRVQNAEQIRQADRLPCDMLLLDTYQTGQYGGSGRAFDHSMIPAMRKPFMLAGGLDISNIEAAIRRCAPYGVDISSGVETEGLKDETKIRNIIQTVGSLNG